MRIKTVIVFLLASLSFSCSAQFLDSLKTFLKQKPRIAFRFDTKTSFISANNVSIWGINLGLDFDKKLKTGFGYYFLFSDFSKNKVVSRENNLPDTSVNARLNFNYGGIFVEYVFYNKKRWEICFPLHLGIGVSKYRYDLNKLPYETEPRLMGLYEANLCAQYRIFFWLGVGGGIGYRLMLIDNRMNDESFTSPIYSVKVKIFFGDLYRKYFPKKENQGVQGP
ncbi:MAG: hypothetical protein HY958_12935 [Bacteroidia bacterium]|nr:hypothetical protein [Bacteroidia bacterium]